MSNSEGIENPLPLGEILIARGLITKEQLKEGLKEQKSSQKLIGEILTSKGYVKELDVVVAVILQCSLPYIAINKYQINRKVLKMIPVDTAKKYLIIPLDRVGEVLSLVMANPLDQELVERLEQLTRCKIARFIATPTEIKDAIAHWYDKRKS